ncbi:HAMP domain-containing sensor histidine kinase [Roseateles chitinivorans]|uniref:HAMP domain-containing sensor histidine kinase n=1 Tax=Roseateles chitinivorans TaxID=2917965 RepID=UPI003D67F9A8
MNSLTVKVLVAYLAGVVLTVAALVLLFDGVTRWRGTLYFDEDISEFAEELSEKLVFDATGTPVGFNEDARRYDWMYVKLKGDLAYRLLDASGRVVLASPESEAFWAASGPGARRLAQGNFSFDYGGQPMRGATEVVRHQGRAWYFQQAGSARLFELFHVEFAMPFMSKGMGLFATTLLLVFGVCAYLTLRRVLKPLHEVSASAAAISPRSVHGRLQIDRVPTEIVPLVESFNRALDSLERGYRVQQEFLATAAHELKTPLALIRAQVEFMAAGKGPDMLLQDVEHMTRQVQQLLLLAEASETQNYTFAPTDVGAAAREAVEYLTRMSSARGVELEVRHEPRDPRDPQALAPRQPPAPHEPVLWAADRGALFTLLKNLLENAIQHAPAGSRISVEIEADRLSVRDRGPGVAPHQLDRMFARFWRGVHRRDHGAGLGLAICQEIAEAHGWTLTAQPEDPGLRMVVAKSPA